MFDEFWSINFSSQLIFSYLSHLCPGLNSATKFTKLTIFRDDFAKTTKFTKLTIFGIVIFVNFVTHFNPEHISSLLIRLSLYFMISWNEKFLKC